MAVSLAACSSTSTPQADPKEAAAIIAKSNSAMQAAGSVAYVVKASLKPTTANPHPVVETLTAEVSAPAAAESIRFSNGQGALDVIFVNNVAYVRGNIATMEQALGMSAQTAPFYAGQWISVQPSDTPFKAISESLTLTSQIQAFIPQGKKVTVSNVTINGHSLAALTGPATPNASITSGVTRVYISNATSLPTTAGVVGATKRGETQEIATFRSWGKKVNLTAPTPSVALSSTFQTPPAG